GIFQGIACYMYPSDTWVEMWPNAADSIAGTSGHTGQNVTKAYGAFWRFNNINNDPINGTPGSVDDNDPLTPPSSPYDSTDRFGVRWQVHSDRSVWRLAPACTWVQAPETFNGSIAGVASDGRIVVQAYSDLWHLYGTAAGQWENYTGKPVNSAAR